MGRYLIALLWWFDDAHAARRRRRTIQQAGPQPCPCDTMWCASGKTPKAIRGAADPETI